MGVKGQILKSLFSDQLLCTSIHCSVPTQEREMPLEEESKSDLNRKFARGERRGEENSRPAKRESGPLNSQPDLKSEVLWSSSHRRRCWSRREAEVQYRTEGQATTKIF
nr:hypothetical protein Itr_chr13CG19260 [Ipomoea trifida]